MEVFDRQAPKKLSANLGEWHQRLCAKPTQLHEKNSSVTEYKGSQSKSHHFHRLIAETPGWESGQIKKTKLYLASNRAIILPSSFSGQRR